VKTEIKFILNNENILTELNPSLTFWITLGTTKNLREQKKAAAKAIAARVLF